MLAAAIAVRCVRLVIYRSTERDALCKATIGTQDLTVNPAGRQGRQGMTPSWQYLQAGEGVLVGVVCGGVLSVPDLTGEE